MLRLGLAAACRVLRKSRSTNVCVHLIAFSLVSVTPAARAASARPLVSVRGRTQAASTPSTTPFSDISASSGLDNNGAGRGVAWGDYDDDGFVDLYVVNEGGQINLLFRNDAGGGTFTDVSAASNTNTGGYTEAVAWGDYDNDGGLDLFIVNFYGTDRLFHNERNGTFTDVTFTSGTSDSNDGRGASWADYDNDGLLDLYVANYFQANTLYHNNGDGTFSDVSVSSGTNDGSFSRAATWGDFDNDGDADLFVTNGGVNRLYRNEGDGTFQDIAAAAGLGDGADYVGAEWGDYDNDGYLDLYVTVYGAPNKLYRNNAGSGTFTDMAAASGTADWDLGYGLAWGDYDNDGYLDLYVSNTGTANKLYRNNGDGTFADVSAASGTDDAGHSTGAAWADFNNDGRLDLYVANNGEPNKLYENVSGPAPGAHWLQIDLRGVQSNRSAIGARVRVVTGSLAQIREVSGGSGYGSQNSLTLEFGLGSATTVDSIQIRWPSGVIQDTSGVAVDQKLVLVEHADLVDPVDLAPIGNLDVPEGSADSVAVSATDPEAEPIALSFSGPPFASLTDNGDGTGIVRAFPGYSDATDSPYPASVTATALGASDVETFAIVVSNTDRAVTLDSIPDMTLIENQTDWRLVSASDPDGDAISLSLVGPAFASLTGQEGGVGTLAVTPATGDAGSYQATVTATAGADSTSRTFGITVGTVVGVADTEPAPASLRLHSGRPNPTSGNSAIQFDLPQSEAVWLRAFDASGRLVRIILPGIRYPAGRHTVRWDGLTRDGTPLPSGVYFLRLDAARARAVRPIVLLR